MKITIELELDQEAYDKEHGPGSEFWQKYHSGDDPKTYWANKPNWLRAAVVDVLHEGFYDWDSKGWMKLKIDGKSGCKCCGWTEGHQSWCDHAKANAA